MSYQPQGLLRIPTYVFGKLHKALYSQVNSSLREYWVLVCLEEQGDVSQQEISNGMGIDRSEVVHIIDSLESAGFVTRTRNEADRRKYRLDITDVGRAERRRVTAQIDGATERVLNRLDDDERATLHRLALKAVGYDEYLQPLPGPEFITAPGTHH
ncbi:MAG TPA: MarR family transcriptional regulator [Galbitalea sp.]|jgi:DNA-binding MarR family transcriptional regulator|nr:MarR family transcriptional regulator [Galbitalea sp.]